MSTALEGVSSSNMVDERAVRFFGTRISRYVFSNLSCFLHSSSSSSVQDHPEVSPSSATISSLRKKIDGRLPAACISHMHAERLLKWKFPFQSLKGPSCTMAAILITLPFHPSIPVPIPISIQFHPYIQIPVHLYPSQFPPRVHPSRPPNIPKFHLFLPPSSKPITNSQPNPLSNPIPIPIPVPNPMPSSTLFVPW